jgi:hypothetical protein
MRRGTSRRGEACTARPREPDDEPNDERDGRDDAKLTQRLTVSIVCQSELVAVQVRAALGRHA